MTSAIALPARGDSVQTWATPPHIVHAIERDSFGGTPFALDCCAQPSTAKAARFYALERGENAMALPWVDATWMNPPYENQDEWLARAAYFAGIGVNVACLVLASTSSLYWLPATHRRGTVDFYRGRIAFLAGEGGFWTKGAKPKFTPEGQPVEGASFSSALVLLGPRFRRGAIRYRNAETGELEREGDTLDLFSLVSA